MTARRFRRFTGNSADVPRHRAASRALKVPYVATKTMGSRGDLSWLRVAFRLLKHIGPEMRAARRLRLY